jgi:hypothetical protein
MGANFPVEKGEKLLVWLSEPSKYDSKPGARNVQVFVTQVQECVLSAFPKRFPVGLARLARGQPGGSEPWPHRLRAFAPSSFSARKYLGYFCGGDVIVWLHKHLHDLGEGRRAAGGG